MTTRKVNREISRALEWSGRDCTGPVVDGQEAKKIVEAAEKGRLGQPTPVTVGEGKAIADLFERTPVRSRDAGHFMTLACPENPGGTMAPDAAETFNAFFLRNNLPYGEGLEAVKKRIDKALEGFDYTGALFCPPDVSHLHHVFLRDARPVGGNRLDAYVDAEKGEFYLKVTSSGMAGPDTIGPSWYGPLKLAAVQDAPMKPEVTNRTLQRIDFSLGVAKARGKLAWKPLAEVLPVGQRWHEVKLTDRSYPDAINYRALLVLPEDGDPNKATKFYVTREGGIAGLRQAAGPFDLETPYSTMAVGEAPDADFRPDFTGVLEG